MRPSLLPSPPHLSLGLLLPFLSRASPCTLVLAILPFQWTPSHDFLFSLLCFMTSTCPPPTLTDVLSCPSSLPASHPPPPPPPPRTNTNTPGFSCPIQVSHGRVSPLLLPFCLVTSLPSSLSSPSFSRSTSHSCRAWLCLFPLLHLSFLHPSPLFLVRCFSFPDQASYRPLSFLSALPSLADSRTFPRPSSGLAGPSRGVRKWLGEKLGTAGSPSGGAPSPTGAGGGPSQLPGALGGAGGGDPQLRPGGVLLLNSLRRLLVAVKLFESMLTGWCGGFVAQRPPQAPRLLTEKQGSLSRGSGPSLSR